jgi:hypothetical protein
MNPWRFTPLCTEKLNVYDDLPAHSILKMSSVIEREVPPTMFSKKVRSFLVKLRAEPNVVNCGPHLLCNSAEASRIHHCNNHVQNMIC